MSAFAEAVKIERKKADVGAKNKIDFAGRLANRASLVCVCQRTLGTQSR
jgi:hypothetical protein